MAILLSGKDVIGVAETGSGKTFAFGVPAINNIITTGNTKHYLYYVFHQLEN